MIRTLMHRCKAGRREDCLTDSESDDEEAYALEKPSLVRARQILWDKQPDDEAAGDAGG